MDLDLIFRNLDLDLDLDLDLEFDLEFLYLLPLHPHSPPCIGYKFGPAY